jgi:hypothetical protein
VGCTTVAIDPADLYARLGELLGTMPDLDAPGEIPADTHRWLAQAYVLVNAAGLSMDALQLKHSTEWLCRPFGYEGQAAIIRGIVHRAFAVVEFKTPPAARGMFITAGNVHDAMVRIGKVFQAAKSDVLIVDPYMNEKLLSDFALMIPEGASMRLLADRYQVEKKATLLHPAVKRWEKQHGSARPLRTKLAQRGKLHDRSIMIDGADAWVLTQSFNAFAERAHGLIVQVDSETAALKISAYHELWQSAIDMV